MALPVQPDHPRLQEFVEGLNRHCRLKITLAELKEAVAAYPPFIHTRPETLIANCVALKRSLKLSSPQLKRLLLSNPSLVKHDPATVHRNHRAMAKWLGKSLKAYLSDIVRFRRLFKVSPTRASAMLQALQDGFGLAEADAHALLRKAPHLLPMAPETVLKNATSIAQTFNIPLKDYIRLAANAPGILMHPPATLQARAERFGALVALPMPLAAQAILKQPNLLAMSPETLEANLRGIAVQLGISQADAIAMARKRPHIVAYRPSSLKAAFDRIVALFDIRAEELRGTLVAHPSLLLNNPDTMAGKIPLVLAVAKALGFDYSPADTLRQCPLAYTYGAERLQQRLVIAEHGIGPRSISNLLSLAQPKALILLQSIQPCRDPRTEVL